MLDRYPLRAKLLGSFVAILLATAALALYLISTMGGVDATYGALLEDNADPVIEARTLDGSLWTIATQARRHVAASEAAVMDEAEAEMAENWVLIDEAFGAISATATVDEAGWLETLDHDLVELRADWQEVTALSRGGDAEAAEGVLRGKVAPALDEAVVQLDALIAFNEDALNTASDAATASFERARLVSIVLALLLVLGGTAFAWWFGRRISGQVADSSTQVHGSAESLAAVSAQVGAAAEETATQANVVAAAGEQVSHNVQTVATAVEEMSASVREIAQSSGEASRVAAEAVRTAEETNANVAQLREVATGLQQLVDGVREQGAPSEPGAGPRPVAAMSPA